MFLCATKRKKDGKEHRYWSVVESRRVHGGQVIQKTLLCDFSMCIFQVCSWVQQQGKRIEESAVEPSGN